MASVMIFILVVMSLSVVHAELGETGSSLSSSSSELSSTSNQARAGNFLFGNSDPSTRSKRGFATKHDYDEDNIDLDKLNDGPARYNLVTPGGSYLDGEDSSAAVDGAPTLKQTPSNSNGRNLARLLFAMPQFNRFYGRFNQPEKRTADIRRFVSDKDDKELTSLNSLATRVYSREPLGRSTERLVQLLRDQLQANPRTYRVAEESNHDPEVHDANYDLVSMDNREKRRRCQYDPSMGIKDPSRCDTDSYFGAADYTMRNVWDSAGRR